MATEQVVSVKIDASHGIKSIKDLREEVKQYRNELVNLERGTKEYNETLQKAAEAQGKINKINADLSASTTNLTGIYQHVTGALSGLAGGFSAVQGVMALTGASGESLEKTFVKLQAALALTQGLTALSSGIKSANVAFKALNITLKANPILLIVGLIASLIGIFGECNTILELITDEFGKVWDSMKELLPSVGDTNKVFDELSKIISGVAHVLIKFISGPIKSLIKLIKGDLKGALDEVKGTFNVISNFEEGYAKQSEKNLEKSLQKLNKAVAERLTLAIEENEAKYGADYKYTKDGESLYRSYYTALGLIHKEGTEEYRKNVLIPQLNFDRELAERRKKSAEEEKNRLKELEDEEKKRIEELKKANLALDEQRESQKKEAEKALTVDQARVDYIREEIKQNEELQKSIQKTIESSSTKTQAKIDETNKLMEIEREHQALQSELANTEAKLNEDRIKYERLLKEKQGFNPDASLEEIEAQKNLQLIAEKDRLLELANTEALTYQQRADALSAYNAIRDKERLEQRKKEDMDAKKDAKQKEELENAKLKYTADALHAGAALLGENTVAGKVMAIAAATINTYQAATLALASVPFPASIPAVATTIATGLAAVKNILSTNVPGSSGSAASADSTPAPVSLPSFPELTEPINETYTNITGADEDFFNGMPQSVLVVEDLSSVQTRVHVAETNSIF